MNNKKAYVEPKDAPPGVPCRFCDLPSFTDGLGPVHQDGVAVDKKRPLFSHKYCLMNSGGKKQDNYDFSLQNLLPDGLKSPYANNLEGSAEDNIWAFANKMKSEATPAVQPMTRVNTTEEYDADDTAAPRPPTK
jgi:hypothetical protein